MNSGKYFSLIKKIFLLFLMIVFSLPSTAAENSVLGINIRQNNQGGYNILLKLNKFTAAKKTFDGQKLIITIPSAVPSDSTEIVYDNASKLQNVTIQKKNKNSAIIALQGEDIEHSLIFIKDISTGLTKEIGASGNIMSNFLFIADKKTLALFCFSSLFILAIMAASKPKEQEQVSVKYTSSAAKYQSKSMTLRRKNMLQSGNIPSINYRHNGSFISSDMSIPDGLKFNYGNIEEKIRKAG